VFRDRCLFQPSVNLPAKTEDNVWNQEHVLVEKTISALPVKMTHSVCEK